MCVCVRARVYVRVQYIRTCTVWQIIPLLTACGVLGNDMRECCHLPALDRYVCGQSQCPLCM